METIVRHKTDCKKAWNRFDASCPRCQELLSGAAPRAGWGRKVSDFERRQCEEIRDHFSSHRHLSGGCGPVCTFGDW